MPYEIIRRQSTFWDLRGNDRVVERVHFVGKEEFGFSEGVVPSLEIPGGAPSAYGVPSSLGYGVRSATGIGIGANCARARGCYRSRDGALALTVALSQTR